MHGHMCGHTCGPGSPYMLQAINMSEACPFSPELGVSTLFSSFFCLRSGTFRALHEREFPLPGSKCLLFQHSLESRKLLGALGPLAEPRSWPTTYQNWPESQQVMARLSTPPHWVSQTAFTALKISILLYIIKTI